MTSLPTGWAETTLGEINRFASRTVDPSNHPDETFELYSVPAFPTRKPEILAGAAIGSTKQAVAPGDVLVSKINPRINRVWQVGPASRYRQIASSEWIVLRTPAFYSPFLRHYCSSPRFRKMICADVSGVGGSLTRAQPQRVATFPIPVAPLAEQKRIADKLDALLARVDACRERLRGVPPILKRFRHAVLAAATSGELTADWRAGHPDVEPAERLLKRVRTERRRKWEEAELSAMEVRGKMPTDDRWRLKYREPEPPDTKDLPALPEGWSWVRLEQVADVQLGQQRAPVHASARERLPYVRAANITWDGLDLTNVKEMGFPNPQRYELRYGDVLLSEGSGSPMEVGKPAIWRDEIPGACYQKTLLRVRVVADSAVMAEFLRVVFLRDCVTGRFARLAPGVGIVHLTAERMLVWPIPLPPVAEQRRIVEKVDRLEAAYNALKTSIALEVQHLDRIRQSVFKSAFEGEFTKAFSDGLSRNEPVGAGLVVRVGE